MSQGFMYILKCSDNSYYPGSTVDLEKRINEHFEGMGPNYTKSRRPVILVYYEIFDKIKDAARREKQIKGWSRAKKELLIKGLLDELIIISNSKKSSNR